MKNFSRAPTRWLSGAAAGIVALTPGERLSAAPRLDLSVRSIQRAALARFSRGFENVLGTSLDLCIEAARPSDALACEAGVLAEIERLRRILSTYDPASEIRRVMAGARVESPELQAVLDAYAHWSARTGGLISLHLGGALNVDALGKAFIIDRAVAVARNFAPGGLLNLGGDLRAWGDAAWPIAVTDPRQPADNAPPLARFALRDAAVATSGGYARGAHLIDPRTQRPIAPGGSATIVARDTVTANALSTAASVAGPGHGAALARAQGVADFLLVGTDGSVATGGVLATATATTPAPAPAPATETAAEAAWPAGYQVAVPIVLKSHPGPPREIYRPYVVVWIESEQGRVVRTLTIWGSDERWQGKLTRWAYQARPRRRNELSVTRATRPAGAYTVVWDGTDDFHGPVPAGRYKLSLEICREQGHHVLEEVMLDCGAKPVTAAWKETAESDAVTLSYGPAKP